MTASIFDRSAHVHYVIIRFRLDIPANLATFETKWKKFSIMSWCRMRAWRSYMFMLHSENEHCKTVTPIRAAQTQIAKWRPQIDIDPISIWVVIWELWDNNLSLIIIHVITTANDDDEDDYLSWMSLTHCISICLYAIVYDYSLHGVICVRNETHIISYHTLYHIISLGSRYSTSRSPMVNIG